ncbi:uncharacterized protein N0V89_007469 [Didymosphaeria variabile]|uniref:Uncharacterized protein n=1 Tax=Didymosphaeria variabile TaxID=1932322 RepID=A0A9W8XIX5_9PLEO|nr:uncharacterized protein N0V89_007469 [Didymosphaeria variabile]KAJ4352123.1 hypothetical protein N0V89_007469 [Didymosphaeria variabile]
MANRYNPYTVRKQPAKQLGVSDPKNWAHTPGRWVAFGATAEQDPPSTSNCFVENTSGSEECFKFDVTGTPYYRFQCTPRACGNPKCQGNSRVLMNFTPPGWDLGHPGFGAYGNPMNPDYQGTKDQGFFIEQDGQLVWNSAKWGAEQPPGWGH